MSGLNVHSIEPTSQMKSSMGGLLVGAKVHAQWLRDPKSFDCKPDIGRIVSCYCGELDSLGVPMWAQNNALEMINSAETSSVWERLHTTGDNRLILEMFSI